MEPFVERMLEDQKQREEKRVKLLEQQKKTEEESTI